MVNLKATKTRLSLASIALSGVVLVQIMVHAQAPDNTSNNKQHDVTADQQSNAQADLAITQKIRKALIADKSLSTYAHNVKIITANGVVTLKGPVKTEDEKQKVGSKAGEVVDLSKIDNQLTVKAQ